VSFCLSVRLSQVGWCFVKTDEWIKLLFGVEAFFDLSYAMFEGYLGISVIRYL